MSSYKSPLHQTVATTATDFWNDSCSVEELTYAIEHGATGATSAIPAREPATSIARLATRTLRRIGPAD